MLTILPSQKQTRLKTRTIPPPCTPLLLHAHFLLSFKLCFLKAHFISCFSTSSPFIYKGWKFGFCLRWICSSYDYWCPPDWWIDEALLLEISVVLLFPSLWNWTFTRLLWFFCLLLDYSFLIFLKVLLLDIGVPRVCSSIHCLLTVLSDLSSIFHFSDSQVNISN